MPMRILLTGGTGIVGKAIIELLANEGHETLVIGRREEGKIARAEYRSCDVNNFASLLEISRGFDAIIHLAAIPNPFAGSPEEIYRVNCSGTYNVHEAAARNGISRVVTASSINAFGYCYGSMPFRIDYFPVDEQTPGSTTDVYSFSKVMTEEIAAYHARRYGLSCACIRIPWVYRATEEVIGELSSRLSLYRDTWSELRSTPGEARKHMIAELIADFDSWRIDQYDADPAKRDRDHRRYHKNPLFIGRNNLWTLVDERDSAQGFVKATTAKYEGAHVLFINDSHNWTGIDSRELVETMFPAPETWSGVWKREPRGTESLISIDRARDLIGFEPEHSLARFFATG